MHFHSQRWLLDRRYALRALGTCIALPFLECMVPLRAAEEQTATPRRSAFIYLANGVHSLNYQITKTGKDYQFSRSLKPLEKHREAITPISGLHHPGALSHHHNCISVWLTGGKLGPSDRNTISVDQKMAEITAKAIPAIHRWRCADAGLACLDRRRSSLARHAPLQRDLCVAV
ncbi:MAG: DUF1552 domain-containing protein [Pirellulales bacterium]